MKCKYCHADIERGARFCTSCGKDLSVFDKCVNCGELLEKDTRHCPYCGTEQPHKEVAEPKGSKKWIWAVACVLLLCAIGGGFYFLKGNSFGWSQAGEIEDNNAKIDIHSVDGLKARLDEILSKGLKMDDRDVVNTYFSSEFKKLYAKVEEVDNNFTQDGPGFWNGNIWDGGQNGNPTGFRINSVSDPIENRAVAEICFIYEEGDYHSENLSSVELVFENGNWYIDNQEDKQSMKEYIEWGEKEANAQDLIVNNVKVKKEKNNSICSIEMEYPVGGNKQVVDVIRRWIVSVMNNRTGLSYDGDCEDGYAMATFYCNSFVRQQEYTICENIFSKKHDNSSYVTYCSSGNGGGASQHYWTEFLTVNKETGGKVEYETLFAGDWQELINTIYQYKSEDYPIDELESCEIKDAMLTPDKAVFVVSGFHGNYTIDVPVSSIKKYLSEEGKKIISSSVN